MSALSSRDRVRISDANTPVVESLGEKTDAARVFQNQAKAVAFAASVGYHFNRYEPVTGQTSKAIHFEQINRATDLGVDLVAVFALAHTKSIDVLAARNDEDESDDATDPVLIFEGYVNGGLSYIRKQGFDAAQPIKAVRGLVRTLNPEPSDILNRS
jgi:dnd system-associated protein 4